MTVTGAASADLALEGRAAVGLDAAGRPEAAFGTLRAALSGLQLDIDLGPLIDWTGLGSVVGDAIAAQVRGPVQEAIRAAVQGLLEERLSSLLASLADLRAAVALPRALGGVELVVEGAVDALDFTAAGAVLASAVQVRPAAPRPEHLGEATPGAMRMGSSLGAAPDLGGAALGLGLAEDVVNQLLHAAWLGGAFDAEDLAQRVDLGLPGARVAVFSRLPPVLMPREAGAPGLDLGWGGVDFDLYLPGFRGGAEVQGTLSVVLPLDGLEADAGGIRLVPGDPAVDVQVTGVSWEPRPQARALAGELVAGTVRSLLPRLLSDAAGAFPLPTLDLATVDPGLPPLVLSFPDPRAARAGGYLLLSADVAAVP
jgi:hypothetical protein